MTTSRHGNEGGRSGPAEPAPAGGLAPEALFEAATGEGGERALQWLAHLQRLASTGLLAGGMAHDLAGLVQPLLGEAERGLLQEDPAEHRLALIRMREWARRCESYVRALLDLVRRDEQHRTVVDVEAVVEDTLQLLESTQRTIGVSMRRDLDNHHAALVDRTRLMQALVNLVTNALRAARAGGREVDVTVRGWRGWVVIEVEDNGPGIPAEIRERLFQPFVRTSATGVPAASGEPPEPEGTGLGLYITKRLIREQGGRVEFETDEGVGTVFRVMLEPAPVDGATPDEGVMSKDRQEKRGRPQR